ncbi:MAG: isoprenylcysteine carboxylmethyltransferase family protein [Chloroflexota bacterium]|nr:isoprenylcysteine carboxylmethyltransferase family protein [Chloroflexota bacterium]
MDDRALRIALVLAGHIIWLSAAALRILRGRRAHQLRGGAPWWIEYYPPLVWLPLLGVLIARPFSLDLDPTVRYAGLALAWSAALFAAWAMWSLGRGYGIRTDLFAGHELKTDGAYGLVRHPMYLGVIAFHVGASLALVSLMLLVATAILIVPYTAARSAAEERLLRRAFGRSFAAYAAAVPALVPSPRSLLQRAHQEAPSQR